MVSETAQTIAIIGFGEAGRAFVSGWKTAGSSRFAAYDIKTEDAATAEAMKAAFATADVVGCDRVGDALSSADLSFCLVPADQTVAAARAAAPHLTRGALWVDGTSSAPGTKHAAAELIEAAGGRYVDMAIMAPVHPKLHRTPVLLSGMEAQRALACLDALGMDASVVGTRVGDASAIKMIRSVMVKGMEALTAECLLAARRAGVEDAVLASLRNSGPARDWEAQALYNLGRMTQHGIRRAAEMREVATTLRELGLPDRLASATAVWQEQIGSIGGEAGTDLGAELDRLLKAMR